MSDYLIYPNGKRVILEDGEIGPFLDCILFVLGRSTPCRYDANEYDLMNLDVKTIKVDGFFDYPRLYDIHEGDIELILLDKSGVTVSTSLPLGIPKAPVYSNTEKANRFWKAAKKLLTDVLKEIENE